MVDSCHQWFRVRTLDLLGWMKSNNFYVVHFKQRNTVMETNLEVNSLVFL